MRPDDRAAFANAMMRTAITLGTEKPGEQRLLAYWEALEAYPLEMVTEALKRLVRTETFYPAPAKILEMIGYLHEERQRATPDDKVSEWERDRRENPEAYPDEEEMREFLAELNNRLGWSVDKYMNGRQAKGR